MGKADKKQLSDELNEALGLDIDFTRLKAEDLAKLHAFVSGGLVDAGITVGVHRAKGIGHMLVEMAADKLRARLAKG